MHNKKYSKYCTIIQLFEEQVRLTPKNIAVTFNDEYLTYESLNNKANQLAHYLKGKIPHRCKSIAILMDRSFEMVISIVAIMKLGRAYLPLEPDLPILRLDYILKNAEISILIIESRHRDKLPVFNGTLLELDRYHADLDQYSAENLFFDAKPSDIAYIIYTSGSTGNPKGCILSHRAVCNRLLWMQEEFHFTEKDRFLQKTPYGFDVSVWEFFCPLIIGAVLVLAKPGKHKDPGYLVDLIIQEKITICHFVPSMLQVLLNESGIGGCKSLRYIMCSGEALSLELMQEFYKKFNDIILVNLYGPTEAAIDVTYWVCDKTFTKNPLPIGKPIANVDIFILDESLMPVAIGNIGEIYISGICLAEGYLNQDNLTKERFIANPFNEAPDAKLYKTGDLGCYLCDGNILYYGRYDDQVKIRGNRIELGEIETALCSHLNVRMAVVIVDKNDDNANLLAFVQLHNKHDSISSELGDYLKTKLPSYMLPYKYIVMDSFPLTSNGKLDKKKLQSDYSSKCLEQPKTIDKLIEVVRTIMGMSDITPIEDLFTRGATSLTMVRLLQKFEALFSIKIPIDIFLKTPTIQAIYNYLQSVDRNTNNNIDINQSEKIANSLDNSVHQVSINQLMQLIAPILKIENLKTDDDLFSLGATSLTMIRITQKLLSVYQLKIPIDVFMKKPTVSGIYEFLIKNQTEISTTILTNNNDIDVLNDQKNSTKIDFFSIDERTKFKDKKYNIRKVDKNTAIGTSDVFYTQQQLIDRYFSNRSRREFLNIPIAFANFMKFLSCLGQQDINGYKKYQYQSAGGTYAVQTYVHVKKDAVAQLEEGIYYYHPDDNKLYLICRNPCIPLEVHFYYNRPIYERAAFSIYFIAAMQAITPIYGELRSRDFVTLEVGSMMQLLMNSQIEVDVGICAMGTINFNTIRDNFFLDPSHQFLQCLVGGYCEPDINHSVEVTSTEPKALTLDNQDFAIIGISGQFPGAKTLDQYWENLKNGKSSIQQVPASRWDYTQFHHPETSTHTKWGGFIDNVDQFDPLIFNISPAQAHSIDPQERLFLQETWAALENAGYTADALNKNAKHVGVFVGVMWDDYLSVARDLSTQVYTLTTARHSIANRVSYCFNFQGPSMVIDTSCSSGLTAIHLACESLKSGHCNVAIAGGVNLILHPNHYLHLNSMLMVSENHKCNAFSENGTGWVPGEGVGVIVLKPLAQAIADKDNIQAVIKGSFINHSGRTHQFGMPNPDAQADLLTQALRQAKVTIDSIDYIECASNGALMFDSAEFSGLQKVFKARDKKLPRCRIGSVKPNIGHLESASALSQLVKVILQLKYQQFVPTIEVDKVNSLIELDNSPFILQQELSDWVQHSPRRAAITALGGSGSYGHLIVEEYIADETELSLEEIIIIFSAATPEQLTEYIKIFCDYLADVNIKINLLDLAYTLQVGRIAMEYRAAFCTSNLDISNLKNKLAAFDLNNPKDVFLSHRQSSTNANSEMQKIAQRWVNGDNISWNDLYLTHKPRKISLPNYPFKKNRYWVKPLQQETWLPQKNKLFFPLEADDVYKSGYFEKITSYLKQIFSKILEIPENILKANSSFEELGITSLLINQLFYELVKDFPALKKAVFFECQTIKALANHLEIYHKAALSALFSQTSSTIYMNRSETQTSNDSVIPNNDSDGIAVIGIHGRYPGASDIQEFWNNLKEGRDCITEIPKDRWDYQNFPELSIYTRGMPFCKWGGFIEDVDKFDVSFFSIAPSDAEKMDPQERLVLESAWHAIEDAGYSTHSLCHQSNDGGINRIGVFVGVMWSEYPTFSIEKNQYAPFPHTTFWSIANRISYFLDFQGPSITLDTACSASLSALHMACESIRRGESRYALVSGVNLSLHPNKYLALAQMGFTSVKGKCHSFGSESDGYVPAEGVGTLLLKPVKKARADGDHIYGVIKATSVNHGGKTHGYTVPNPLAQSHLIMDALRKAQLTPTDISYIEAHGTGTPLGDPIEIQGLCNAFSISTSSEQQYCSIGTVKSNIGHAEAAAGIAGITKVLLQLQYKMLVPTLHVDNVNSDIDFENSPFYLQRELSNWKHNNQNTTTNFKPLYAGISSFGAGGSNAHAIIEEAEPQPVVENNKPYYLITLSAKTEQVLVQKINDMIVWLKSEKSENKNLQAISFTLNVGRNHFAYRDAWIVASKDELLIMLTDSLGSHKSRSFLGIVSNNITNVDTKIYEMALETALKQLTDVKNSDKYLTHLKIIADCYIKGLDFDLSLLHNNEVKTRISLPLYPFVRERFWIPEIQVDSSSNDILSCDQSQTRRRYWLFEEWIEKICKNHNQLSQCSIIFDSTSLPLVNMLSALIRDASLIDIEKTTELEKYKFNYLIDLVTTQNEKVDKLIIQFLQRNIGYNRTEPLTIVYVTKGLERYKNAEPIILGAHKAGLYKMLSYEYSYVRSKHLDLDPYCLDTHTNAQLILKEFFAEGQETSVCIRNGNRYIKQFILKAPVQQLGSRFTLKSDEVLVITGGTRGIGMECAKHFIQQYGVKKVVLIGRQINFLDSTKDRDKSELTLQEREKLENIDLLKTMGAEVKVLAARLDDPLDTVHVISQIISEMGPIVGIIHAAGITDTDTLAFIHKPLEKIRAVLSPKIAGTRNLLQALVNKTSLKFFLLFSSISALIPKFAVGFSDYAMANSYMDYFSQNTPNVPVISIRWPSWKEVGMGEVTSSIYLDTGLLSITTQEGLEFIDEALQNQLDKVLTPIVVNLEKFSIDHLSSLPKKILTIKEPQLSELKNVVSQESNSDTYWLMNIFEQELKLKKGTMDLNTPFQNYGADSILLTHILRQIKQKVSHDIEASILYEYTTIAKLANWLREKFPEKLKNIIDVIDGASLVEEERLKKANPIGIADYEGIVAVVGISCQFPGAADLPAYWNLLVDGKCAITKVPIDCWGTANDYYAGLIENIYDFDPNFFMIPESDARIMDPQAILLLKESLYALADAGYDSSSLNEEKVGVYIGARNQYQIPENVLDGVRNPIMLIGQNYLSANISQFFNFTGPSIVFDTACSSALVGMSMAIDDIQSGKVHAALVGGISLLLSPYAHEVFKKRNLLAQGKEFHIFDQRASGTILGEGIGVVILKSLKQAIQDNDRIYATLAGIAVNNGGRTAGPATPNIDAQKSVMQCALAQAGCDPSSVTYIDANGSGSEVTDLLELKSIDSIYRSRIEQPCFLGSIKPNIGHPLIAEGIASFIKVCLMLQKQSMVPFLSGQQPLAHFSLENRNLILPRTARSISLPFAAINCFADGGTNVHVILKHYIPKTQHGIDKKSINKPVLNLHDIRKIAKTVGG